MKYAQWIAGLLIGTALGATVLMAERRFAPDLQAGAGMDAKQVSALVRSTLMEDPQIIIDAVQKFQEQQRQAEVETSAETLKDPAVQADLYDREAIPSVGPRDSRKTVVEFFDYNCPACKMQFTSIQALMKKRSDVRVIFQEYPIFGAPSETNAALALGVFHHYPEQYFAFHEAMMGSKERIDEAHALALIAKLGMDVKKVQAYAASDAALETLHTTQALAAKLKIRGTPSLLIGNHPIPHAAELEEIEHWLDEAGE